MLHTTVHEKGKYISTGHIRQTHTHSRREGINTGLTYVPLQDYQCMCPPYCHNIWSFGRQNPLAYSWSPRQRSECRQPSGRTWQAEMPRTPEQRDGECTHLVGRIQHETVDKKCYQFYVDRLTMRKIVLVGHNLSNVKSRDCIIRNSVNWVTLEYYTRKLGIYVDDQG